jgi:hypothetical protein
MFVVPLFVIVCMRVWKAYFKTALAENTSLLKHAMRSGSVKNALHTSDDTNEEETGAYRQSEIRMSALSQTF